jgi:hypothetical protein
MSVKWNLRTRTYAILVILLCLFLVGAFRGAHELGTGQAFHDYLKLSGLTAQDWTNASDDTIAAARYYSSTKSIPYAMLMTFSMLFIGLAVIASVAYTLRERFLTRLRTSVIALTLSGLAGMFSGFSNAEFGSSSNYFMNGGIGISIIVFVSFYVLTGLLALGRKAIIFVFNLPEHAIGPLPSETEQAQRMEQIDPNRPNWWRRRSHNFRRWIFGSVIWVVFVFLFVAIFDPFTNGSWYYMEDDEYNKMFFTMSIPWIAGGIKYLYEKFV